MARARACACAWAMLSALVAAVLPALVATAGVHGAVPRVVYSLSLHPSGWKSPGDVVTTCFRRFLQLNPAWQVMPIVI